MIILYLIAIVSLSIFSYTQVDLNLTLLNWQPYLVFQKQLTQLGYYNRPLNALIFLTIFVLFSVVYFRLIQKSLKDKLSLGFLKKLILTVSVILALGYPIFSHDIFNYIFDAKILTTYHLNPYQYKALDFPSDDWTRFMQWTHRTYPYGPLWLLITTIPSFLGLGKFFITFYLFKLLFLASYLIACIYIYKIIDYLKKENAITATILFAFHPLVLVDALLSPHLDIAMIAISLVSIYYFLQSTKKSYVKSWGYLVGSILIKFATISFVPFFIPSVLKKLQTQKWIFGLFIVSCLTAILQTLSQGHLQPWYILLPISIFPLYFNQSKKPYLVALITILPLWIYIYFLTTGSWINVLWFI